MDSTPPKKIAFVLTSSGDDVFARMQEIAARTARLHVPGAHLILVVDSVSHAALQTKAPRLLALFDECHAVDTPAGTPGLVSRWLKTALRELIRGDFLFLDADVVVRADISALWDCRGDVGGVYDSNAAAPYFAGFERERYAVMGWPLPTHGSVNTGVLFWRDTPSARELARTWQERWLELVDRTGQHLDQQAFNRALAELSLRPVLFHDRFNGQGAKNPGMFLDASIWHFMHSHDRRHPTTYWERSLLAASHAAMMLDWIERPHPFLRNDLLTRHLLRQLAAARQPVGLFDWRRVAIEQGPGAALICSARNLVAKIFGRRTKDWIKKVIPALRLT